ncbi:MAG: hypothetical protein P8045_13060 [Candidatus Thiodiazotropha sp.]
MEDRELLALVELGGYPNFVPLYQHLGYRVEMVNSVRKAQAWLKSHRPAVVVAEFYADPQFRDRVSNLESLLATLQRYDIEAGVVVFLDTDYLPHLEKVRTRYNVNAVLTYPIQADELEKTLQNL